MLDRAIAVHRRAGDELEIGMQCREHDRDGIVRAGIDVEDELALGIMVPARSLMVI